MSIFLVNGKRWRYDFTLKGVRYTKAGFLTKQEAKRAEFLRREEIRNPNLIITETPTGMAFLELVNRRLDYEKEYHSHRHYTDQVYSAKRWVREWGSLTCDEITPEMIQGYLIRRKRETTATTANKELRLIRALFNFGTKPIRRLIDFNPTDGIEPFPTEKRIKYVPPREDILRVILAADPEYQDYLWTTALTLGRIGEINRLTWDEVDLKQRSVVLYTRKKKGGHMTPRRVFMNDRLHEILSRRHSKRKKGIPWVFWHRYWSRKDNQWKEGPFIQRQRSLPTLCKKAGVKRFGFHALRHFGASLLDQSGVPVGSIQRILGHESRITTEIYLHSIGDSERVAMDLLDARFEPESHTKSHKKEKGYGG